MGALDDEEFFVVEGRGVALTPGVKLVCQLVVSLVVDRHTVKESVKTTHNTHTPHLHRLFIAMSRAAVNHDGRGGTAPDPLVWSAGVPSQEASSGSRSSGSGISAWGSCYLGNLSGLLCLHLLLVLRILPIGPYTAGLLVKWVSFFGSLHWPGGGLDLGVGVVSCVEFCSFFMSFLGW